MDHSEILLTKDAECRYDGNELAAGTYVIEDTADKTLFCDIVCWAKFYRVDEVDEAREDGLNDARRFAIELREEFSTND